MYFLACYLRPLEGRRNFTRFLILSMEKCVYEMYLREYTDYIDHCLASKEIVFDWVDLNWLKDLICDSDGSMVVKIS